MKFIINCHCDFRYCIAASDVISGCNYLRETSGGADDNEAKLLTKIGIVTEGFDQLGGRFGYGKNPRCRECSDNVLKKSAIDWRSREHAKRTVAVVPSRNINRPDSALSWYGIGKYRGRMTATTLFRTIVWSVSSTSKDPYHGIEMTSHS